MPRTMSLLEPGRQHLPCSGGGSVPSMFAPLLFSACGHFNKQNTSRKVFCCNRSRELSMRYTGYLSYAFNNSAYNYNSPTFTISANIFLIIRIHNRVALASSCMCYLSIQLAIARARDIRKKKVYLIKACSFVLWNVPG